MMLPKDPGFCGDWDKKLTQAELVQLFTRFPLTTLGYITGVAGMLWVADDVIRRGGRCLPFVDMRTCTFRQDLPVPAMQVILPL